MPLKIAFRQPGPGVPDELEIYFPSKLHKRGTDTYLYANKWDDGSFRFEPGHSEVMRAVITALMNDDAGVESVQIAKYSLRVRRSRVVSEKDIQDRVLAALQRLCKPVRVVDPI